MGIEAVAYFERFQMLPPAFWAVMFFIVGCVVGSFLNVCIHRLPRGESLVSPPSHCPHCRYAIPWYLNVPLLTWLMLRGRCRNCKAPIAARYFLVELGTGLAFLASWLRFGGNSPATAAVYAVLLAGLITAAFIDLEHYIIPDEITKGGIVAGLLCSLFVPSLHGQLTAAAGLVMAGVGAAVGGGAIYAVVRAGKLLFGRQKLQLPQHSRVSFSEEELILPDGPIRYDEIFYRDSDTIRCDGHRVELVDRCYPEATIRLSPKKLRIGEDEFQPETVRYLSAETDLVVLPREAMGAGDVKFMAAIGAFLGWKAAVFSLFASAVLGTVGGGITLLVRRRGGNSTMIQYGPYIALAAVVWMFAGPELLNWYLGTMPRR